MNKICMIIKCDREVYGRKVWCRRHWQQWYRKGDPVPKKTEVGAPREFFEKSMLIEQDDCIIWPYACTSAGYGMLYVNSGNKTTHRLALIFHIGEPIGSKNFALHKPIVCHNRLCFNYKHLYWGDDSDNRKDQFTDGVSIRGERVGSALLVEDQVMAIFNSSASHTSTARQYGVSEANVRSIRSGRSWSWLTAGKHNPNKVVMQEV